MESCKACRENLTIVTENHCFAFFTSADSQLWTKKFTQEHIKKARESELIAHPACSGSGIAHLPRISNAEAHAVCILKEKHAYP